MEKIPTHRSSRTAAILMAAAAVMPLSSHVAHAQSLVQQEVARRAAQVQEADAALLEGRKLYAESKYEEAVAQYKKALSLLPSGPAVADRRHAYTGHLVDGSIALTQQYRRIGRYQEARELLTEVLNKDPLNMAAKQQLEYLDDPIRTNPVLTYEHTQDTEKVRKHLYRSEGYYNLGQYDEAEEEYKEVLRIDRYNKAARRGLERIANTKSDYYRAAYDHTRSELLKEVDAAWELTVAPRVQFTDDLTGTSQQDVTGALYIRRKLQNIILPLVDFQDISVTDAVDQLRQRARELDTLELDPTKKGVNFVVITPKSNSGSEDAAASEFGASTSTSSTTIDSLQMRNVPLEVALQQICDKAGLRYKVEDYAVKLLPVNEFEDTELYTRSFSVPPDFMTLIGDTSGSASAASSDPFADPVDSGGGSGIAATPPVKDLLEKSGVVFPDGATASFSRARSALTVRNTANNLDIVEQLVNDIKNQKPKQIRIATKFVEVTQENTDELSFDWILSPVTLNGSATQFLSGGTIGSGAPRIGSDFTSPQIPGIPSDPTANVSNIVTAGNRTGTYAIDRNAIDAFLNNPNRLASGNTAAPGILSLSGVYGDGQVQMIMRGLSQKKGADIMTAPSIVARSGEKATIEIIREFIYPTEYEPPELPNSVGSNNNTGTTGILGTTTSSTNSFPVTPATPTAFETRNTGVILEVEPTLGDDGYTIDLRFAPEIVEFEGFINYGSPIQTSGTDALGNPVTVTLTDNRIEMPVFSTRRVTTGLTIYDGHTVAVGGLMKEDVQKVEDKVPVLGDIPLIGRLFQSNSENHTKSNLIIFTTVNIIDATGKSVRNSMGELDSSGASSLGGGSDGLLPTIK
ncbi:Amuc_1098 family type IV pilus outer membrane protein [Rubritalea spongiae]|uniref:Amuc_1098 family type IV pilus outer membrane protein n=1 Tax=Rubritalea spongiae TaxID=430797 RepID=A0ABW5E0T9_9BACT